MSDSFERARSAFLRGVQALERGALAEAEQDLVEALQALPGRPSTLVNLALVRTRLGRAAEALPLLDQVLTLQPTDAEAWGHRGTSLAALGRAEEAVAAFDRALTLEPGSTPARFQRALQLNVLGRPLDALTDLDLLLAARPGDLEALFQRGLVLQALGRPAEALDSYEQLLALQPGAAPAWTQRGGVLKDLGRPAEAAECFRQALARGGDPELNRFFLASVEGGEAPSAAPRTYVEGLFDGYAAGFEQHLVEHLDYRVPDLLVALLPAGWHGAAALDLGCGTGLMAPPLRPRVAAIDGVDLSRRMLDSARSRGLYRTLQHADLGAVLRAGGPTYDLVVAADVFIYVGALDAVFAGVQRALAASGLFLFSVEEADSGRDLQLRTSSRYAHSEAYLRELAARHDFEVRRVTRATLRLDQRQPVGGLCLLLERV
jgi:predicted TPR repeat methyltransferase